MHKRRLSASGAALYDDEILLFILHTGGITCKKKTPPESGVGLSYIISIPDDLPGYLSRRLSLFGFSSSKDPKPQPQ